MKPQHTRTKTIVCARCIGTPGKSISSKGKGFAACEACEGSGRVYKTTTYAPAPPANPDAQ